MKSQQLQEARKVTVGELIADIQLTDETVTECVQRWSKKEKVPAKTIRTVLLESGEYQARIIEAVMRESHYDMAWEDIITICKYQALTKEVLPLAVNLVIEFFDGHLDIDEPVGIDISPIINSGKKDLMANVLTCLKDCMDDEDEYGDPYENVMFRINWLKENGANWPEFTTIAKSIASLRKDQDDYYDDGM